MATIRVVVGLASLIVASVPSAAEVEPPEMVRAEGLDSKRARQTLVRENGALAECIRGDIPLPVDPRAGAVNRVYVEITVASDGKVAEVNAPDPMRLDRSAGDSDSFFTTPDCIVMR